MLKKAIEQVLQPVKDGQNGQESASSSSTAGAIHSAIEKIKDGLYLAMVEVMDDRRRGASWLQAAPATLDGNAAD